MRGPFRLLEMFYIWICVVVTQVHVCVKFTCILFAVLHETRKKLSPVSKHQSLTQLKAFPRSFPSPSTPGQSSAVEKGELR